MNSTSPSGIRAVYLSHNSVGEPLVRSQVLPYLRGLAARGIEVDLVTFERGGRPYPDGEFPRERWHGVDARPGHGLFSKLIDVAKGTWLAIRLVRSRQAHLIHARSYLAAAVAALVAVATKRPFIFDMRGFLGEEYLEGGHWGPRDLRLTALQLAERWLLSRAAAVVVLTSHAERRLRREPRYVAALGETPIVVVPCMVDLAKFRPLERRPRPTLVFAGAVGLRNLVDEVLRVYVAARASLPDLSLLLLNRDDHELIHRSLERAGLRDVVELRAADLTEMPQLLGRSHVGIALQRLGRSKAGASAVKVAEYLASGLPVIVNAGHGDISDLVDEYDAGHVVAAYDAKEIADAAIAVARLATDTSASARARQLAEDAFDLSAGVTRYERLYATLAGGDAPTGGAQTARCAELENDQS